MKRINQLSKHLINQISAGEVIERGASVVKELVENSIDAGATRVEIEISNDTRDIRISDNGSGIHKDDVELAFVKHATSKILTEEDLWNIHSLGFRGEALASILSVSKVVATTRTKDSDTGIRVENNQSEIAKTDAGCAIGTTIEVKDLFYNQPVRLKFLKNPKTEFAYILEIVKSVAISHPSVSFTLKNNASISLQTSGSGDLLSVLSEVYSSALSDNLVPVQKEDRFNGWHVDGFASVPSYIKSSKKSIYIFLNGRVIKCPVILKAIDLAYKNKIAQGKYPFVVLNLTVPPADVDVNVHPTKREIRYKSPNQIFSFVQSSIEAALMGVSGQDNSFDTIVSQKTVDMFNRNFSEDDDVYVDRSLVETPTTEQVMELYKPIGQKKLDIETIYDERPQVDIIGQFANTYILVENEDGIEIVDQHIADERYYYEKLKSMKSADSQLILISDTIEVEPSELELLKENFPKLEKFGYKLEIVGDSSVMFKKLPQMIAHLSPRIILADILENIKGDIDSIEDEILIMTACKASVKAGQKLSIWQMEELIQNWRTTKNPHTCPHGRPISKTISKKEIAGFFNRTN